MDQLLQDWIAKQYEDCTNENEDTGSDDWCLVSEIEAETKTASKVRPISPSFELISDKEILNDHFEGGSNYYGNIDSFTLVEKKRCEELPFIDDDPSLWLDEFGNPMSSETTSEGGESVATRLRSPRQMELEILAHEYEDEVSDDRERTLQEDIERKFMPYEFWDSVPAKNKNQKKREPFARQRLKQYKTKKSIATRWRNRLKKFHYS